MRNLIFVLSAMLTSGIVTGQNKLATGDAAPVFSAPSDDDKIWNLQDYLGKKNVVLYFYPAAMTGGCTKQACSYRDHLGDLGNADAIVVGISGDNVPALKVFKKAQNLNFPLLSDQDGKIAALYGVPVGAGGTITRKIDEVDVVLTRGVTAQRWTFIIGKDGKVKYINTQVDAENDYKAVLEALTVK